MNEDELISIVDCRFPYFDRSLRARRMREAGEISVNAQCMILHELLRVPAGTTVPVSLLHELVAEWKAVATSADLREFATIAALKIDTQPSEPDVRRLSDIGSRISESRCVLGIVEWFSDEVLSDQEQHEIIAEIQSQWNRRRAGW